MSQVWGNETVLQLIELYESHGLLWDTSNRDYRNKIKKNDAWEDIAKTMKLPRKEIENKMHTLRSQFIREKKRIESSKTTGSGRDDVISSAWFAYEALKFLLKGATTSGGMDTLKTQSQQSQDTISMSPNEDAVQLESQSTVQESQTTVQESQSTDQLESQSTIQQAPQSTVMPSSSSRTSRKRTLPNEDRLEEAYEVMQFAKSKMTNQDEFFIYGQYVGSELREVKDEHSVVMAKYYINNILTDPRLGKYHTDHSTESQSTVQSNINPEHIDEQIEQIISHMDSSNTC